jgi:cytochrome c-type biogenesis protein CcmH
MIRQPVTSLQLPLLILTLISILMLSSRTVVAQSPASPPAAQGAASAANPVAGGAAALTVAPTTAPAAAPAAPAANSVAVQNAVPTLNSEQEARFQRLAGDLRCLVCQNQSIAESHADLAIDLKNQVRDQIAQGRTDDDVRRFMVDRYGDFVLYRPPFNARTVALWVGPFLALFLALVILVRTLSRRAGAAPPQEFDAQALAHALERLQPATVRAKDAND